METEVIFTNADALQLEPNLAAVVKPGTKDAKLTRRLRRLVRWLRTGLEEFNNDKKALIEAHAQRDAENKIVNVKIAEIERPAFVDEAAFVAEFGKLLESPFQSELATPEPLTWDEIEKLKEMPDPITIERLGPLAPPLD